METVKPSLLALSSAPSANLQRRAGFRALVEDRSADLAFAGLRERRVGIPPAAQRSAGLVAKPDSRTRQLLAMNAPIADLT